MPIDDDRQSISNNRVELQFAAFDDAFAKELASISIVDPSTTQPTAAPDLLPLVRAASEDIKENHTRYNQNKRDWQEADRKRREEGKDEYSAQRRGEYAGKIKETERRRVRPYGIPNSPQKQANRNAQKNQSKKAALAAMSDAELDAHKTAESAKRKARRHAAKKAELSAKSD